MIYYIVQSTDSRIAGPVKVVMNMDLDSATLAGRVWGKYHIEVPNRGSWDGTWEGDAEGPAKWTYKVALLGSGEFKGLEVLADAVFQTGVGEMLTGQISWKEKRQ